MGWVQRRGQESEVWPVVRYFSSVFLMSTPIIKDPCGIAIGESGDQIQDPPRTPELLSMPLPVLDPEEEVEPFPLTIPKPNRFQVWLAELVSIIRLVLPVIVTYGADFLISVIQLMFVGHMGSTEMAGVALAASFCNVTGYSVVIGLLSAMDTLIAQAFGAQKPEQIGVTVQQSLVVIVLYTFLILPVWFFAAPLLTLLGQDAEVVEFAGLYIRVCWLAILPYGLYSIMRRYLQNQNITAPLMASGALAVVTNVVAFFITTQVLDMGFVGVPVAFVASNWFVMICMAVLMAVSFRDTIRSTWTPWSWAAIRGLGVWLRIAVPGAMMLCAELWGFEINIFLAGVIGTAELAAMTLALNVQTTFYTIPLSISISATTKVGNAVGACNEEQARRIARLILGLVVSVQMLVITFSYSLRTVWPYVFTDDEEVVALVVSVVPVLCVFSLLDATQTALAGILRGVGKQAVGAGAYLISYYAVGLPVSVFLALEWQWGLVGQWIGITSASATSLVILGVYYAWMDWTRLVEETKQRLDAQQATVDNGTSLDTCPDVEMSVWGGSLRDDDSSEETLVPMEQV